MDDVFHFDSPFHFLETVQMVPEAVRADALLVHKLSKRFYLFDFCDPCHGDSGYGGDAVGDDEAVVNFLGNFGGDMETQKGRSDLLQVARVGEERPSLLQRDG